MVNPSEDSRSEEGIVTIAGPELADLGVLVVVVGVWLAIGVRTAVHLARQGHAFRPLCALGCFLGPLLVPYARLALHTHPRRLRVVVGVLTDPERVADVDALLGLVHADHADVEVVTPDGGDPADPAHQRRLAAASLFVHQFAPGTRVVPGTGADAVVTHAHRRRADVVLLVTDRPSANSAPAANSIPRIVVVPAHA